MKDYNSLSRIAYNNMADHYDDTRDGRFTLAFKELLCRTIKYRDNSTILDVACGNGTLLRMLSKRKKIQGYGIDISEKMVENALKNCSDMVFKVAGCENIPFEDDFFDLLTVSAAYHHFPDIHAFAKEASRVLKKGGILYIAEIYLPTILRVLLNPFVPLTGEGDVKFYSPARIVSDLKTYGFEEMDRIIDGKIQVVGLRKCTNMKKEEQK